MSNGARQRGQGRGPGRDDAWVHVRRSRACGGQPVAGQRRGDSGTDEAVLPRNVAREATPGSGAARGADRDVEDATMAVAVLLGGVRAPGRVEVNRDKQNESGESILNGKSTSLNSSHLGI